MLLILLQPKLLDQSVVIFCNFSCNSSSTDRNVGLSVGLSVGRSVRNEFYRSVMLLIVYLSCFYCCSSDYQNILLSYFAFQLRQQLYRSQCQPVGLSVRNEFYGSVMLLLVYDCCFCCLVYNISICDSSSLSRNVGLSVGQYICRSVCLSASNEFYRSDMLLVVNVCCQYYCSLDYQIIRQSYFAILAAIAALQAQCLSVCLSVRNEFYGSVMLFVVYICCQY